MRRFLIALLSAAALSAPATAQQPNCPTCPGGRCPIPAAPSAVPVKVDWYVSPSDPTGWFFEYAGQWHRSPSSDTGATFTHGGVTYFALPYVKKGS